MTDIRAEHFPLAEETDAIIHGAIEVHKELGMGFLEIVYKDALEVEFNKHAIPFTREKLYPVEYGGVVLKHFFVADFVSFDQVILEIKAKKDITPEDIAQTRNYLKCSKCEVGLILNFGKDTLQIKRVVF